MGLPRLESCCFVLDLKTGNIVMGCINAFYSFVLTVVMIVISASVGNTEAELENELDPEAKAELMSLYVMSIILVFMFIAKFIFDLLFIYGVVTERAAIIKAYFILAMVFFLLSMFTFFSNAGSYHGMTIATEVFYLVLNIYIVLLSHSFYKQLNEREEV